MSDREALRRKLRDALHTANEEGRFSERDGLFPSDLDLIVEIVLDEIGEE